MRKILSLFILIFTLCLGSSVFAVSEVSWSDFKACVSHHSGLDLDEVLSEEQNSFISSEFKTSFGKYNRFWVCKDWYWTETPNKNDSGVTTFYFIFYDGGSSSNRIAGYMYDTQLKFRTPFNGARYALDIHTNTLTKLAGENYFLTYNIVSFPDFSTTTWKTRETFDYFLNNISVCGYNVEIDSNFGIITQENDVVSTPFPWLEQPYYPWDEEDDKEDEEVGDNSNNGSQFLGGVPYFINKLDGYHTLGDSLILNVFDVSGDSYNINDYKLRICVYTEGENNVSMVDDVYKTDIWTNYNNNYWSLDLNNIFEFSTDYIYNIFLYDKYGKAIDTSGNFCFNTDFFPSRIENNDYFNNLDNSSLTGLINSSSSWINDIFGFLNIFPSWLVTCILSAITVVVICRILGR